MREAITLTVAFAFGFASAGCELIGGIQDLSLTGSPDGGHDAHRDARPSGDVQAGDGADAADVGADVALLPCSPTPGKGTICAKVSLDPKNLPPAYGALDPGVGKLGINGKGALVVYLFAKDPTGGCDPYVDIPPTTTISVPPSGQGLSVDQLPLTAVGTAPPGMYWIFAFFEDNGPHAAAKVMTRGTGVNAPLPGDLLTPVDTATTRYPTVKLTADTTTMIDLEVQPSRGLEIDFQPTSGLESEATGDPSIKGDGPGSIIVFDGAGGAFDPMSAFLDFAAIPCVNLKLQSKPADATAIVGVTSTGTHQIYGNVFDYALPNVCTNPIPAGSLESSESGTPVIIDPSLWTSSVTLPILGLGPLGSGAGTGPPQLCK